MRNRKLDKNINGIILIVSSSIILCLGQLISKLGFQNGIILVLFGFVMYFIASVLMMLAYKYGELSVLQPMLSLNYAFGAVLGAMVLGEQISAINVLGIIVIMISVISISGEKT